MALAKNNGNFWTLPIFFMLLLCMLAAAKNSMDKYTKTDAGLLIKQKGGMKEKNNREGKLFSLFNIVHFSNDGCSTATSLTSSGGSNRRNGTCFTLNECASKGGMASGNCAAGFGVCCLFITTASGGTISQNCTYLQNPGFPSANTGASPITYTLTKSSSDVCYLRLDFETFTIAGLLNAAGVPVTADAPAVAGSTATLCTDTFIATTSSGQRIPIICGQNTGQHIFLDLGADASDSATLTFTLPAPTGTNPTPTRMWDIKVTQYVCGDPNAPPESCLQYHTGLTGRFTTFNFLATLNNHLPNQQYSVCIRQENGFCCVQYQVCAGLLMAGPPIVNPGFSLSAITTIPAKFDAACAATISSADYIGIADSSSQCNEGLNNVGLRSRYCGGFFNDVSTTANAPICDCTPPFSIEVFTNNVGDMAALMPPPNPNSKGLCLEWAQLPCTG